MGVLGTLAAGVGTGRLARSADTAIVEAHHPESCPEQVRRLEQPGFEVVADAVDEQNRLGAIAFDPIVDLDSPGRHLGRQLGHRAASPASPRSAIALRQYSTDATRSARSSLSGCSQLGIISRIRVTSAAPDSASVSRTRPASIRPWRLRSAVNGQW